MEHSPVINEYNSIKDDLYTLMVTFAVSFNVLWNKLQCKVRTQCMAFDLILIHSSTSILDFILN